MTLNTVSKSVLNLFLGEFTSAHFHHYFLTSLESLPITSLGLYFGLNFTRYTQKMKTFVYSNLLPKVLKRPPNSIPVPFIDSEKLAKRDGHKDPHLSSAFKAGLFCGFSQ